MTPRRCREEVTSLALHLLRTGAALDISTIVERQNSGLTIVEASGASLLPPTAAKREFGDIVEYMEVLGNRRFVCLLRDGATLEISYAFDGDVLISHRLCFQPCPVTFMQDELDLIGEGFSINEIVGLSLEGEWRTRLRLKSPIRFDYDLRAAAVDHPASHLHISSGGCRIPVFGPLSIGHFVRFVFRHFYPELWRSDLTLRGWKMTKLSRSIMDIEEDELFAECRSGEAAKIRRR